MKKVLYFFLSSCLLAACATQENTPFDNPVMPDEANGMYDGSVPQTWWFLFTGKEPKLVLRDLKTDTDIQTLSVPAELKLPKAITYDGISLWVAGTGEGAGIYQLDPETGSVLNKLEIPTTSLSWDGSNVWYLDGQTLRSISNDGKAGESYPIELPEDTKSVTKYKDVVYIFYGDLGYLRKYNLTTNQVEGEETTGLEDALMIFVTQRNYSFTVPRGYFCSWGRHGSEMIDIHIDHPGEVATAMAPNEAIF